MHHILTSSHHQHTQFIGLGITNGGLTGADIWMARSDDTQPWLAQPWHANDYWSSSYDSGPILDSQQDITLVQVTQTSTFTYVVIKRGLDTCDRGQDIKIFNGTDQQVIFAYGPAYDPSIWRTAAATSVPVRLNPLFFNATNATNTTASYYLDLYAQDPPDLQTMSITTNNFVVPKGTSFRCIDLDVTPNLNGPFDDPTTHKYHTIRYSGVAGTSAFDHAVLYACSQPHAKLRPYTCQGKPPPYCGTIYAIWSRTSGNVSLPPAAGLPLGAGSTTSFTLVVTYSNPQGLTLMDTSGFTLYYTPTLRGYDAANLKLGYQGSINPQVNGSQVFLRSTCPAACTGSFPPANINGTNNTAALKMSSVFFVLPSLGSSIQTRHVSWPLNSPSSNPYEVQPVSTRMYWNNSFQYSSVALPDARLLAPGDSLVTECNFTYSSPNETRIISRDYCTSVVLYYPAIPDFTDCSTYDSPDTSYGDTVQACGNADLFVSMGPDDVASYFDNGMLQPSNSDWTLPTNASYVEPCTKYVAPPIVLYTGTAIGSIVLITLTLGALGTLLFFKYARNDQADEDEEDEEERRAAAMAELQQEILAGEIEFVSSSGPVRDEAGPSRGLLGAGTPTTPRQPLFIMAGATRG